MSDKISSNEKHLLRLVKKGRKEDGWTSVSPLVWPFVSKLPVELVELRAIGAGGIVKLTEEGETVLKWL